MRVYYLHNFFKPFIQPPNEVSKQSGLCHPASTADRSQPYFLLSPDSGSESFSAEHSQQPPLTPGSWQRRCTLSGIPGVDWERQGRCSEQRAVRERVRVGECHGSAPDPACSWSLLHNGAASEENSVVSEHTLGLRLPDGDDVGEQEEEADDL